MAGDYNAGSIEASLRLDRTQFNQELDRAKQDARDFANNNYTARASVDATEARMQIRALQSEMAALRDASIGVNLGGTNSVLSQLQALSSQANAVAGDITLNVRVVGADTAMAQLQAVQARAREINNTTSTVNVRTSTETSQTSQRLTDIQQKLDAAGKSALSMSTALVALAPAIAPVTTALLGLAATLASFGAAGGGALGAWTLATMGAIKAAQGHQKAVDDTGKALKSAQQELAKTQAGTDAYKNALAKVTEAEKAHNEALSKLTPAEKSFNDSLTGVKSAYTSFIQATSTYTLKPVQLVLEGVAAALPKVVPLIAALAPTFNTVGQAMKNWLSGNGLEKFIAFIQTYGIPILNNMIDMIRKFMGVGGSILQSFGPVAVQLSAWFQQLGEKVKGWADTGGIERFKASFLQTWNQLQPILRDLGQAIKTIWEALKLGGGGSLALIDALAKIVSVLPPSLINLMVQAWTYYRLAMLAWLAISPLVSAGQWMLATSSTAAAAGLTTSRIAALGHVAAAIALATWSGIVRVATIAWTAANWLLTASFWANPVTWVIAGIVALVAVIVLIATKTTWFQTAWNACWGLVKTVAGAVWGFLRDNWQYLLLILGPVGWLIDIGTHWSTVWNGIKGVASTVWGWLQTAWQATTGAISTAWNAVSGALSTTWNWMVSNIFQPIANFFTQTIPNAAQTLYNFVVDRWNALRDNVSGIWNMILSNVINPLINFFTVQIPNAAATLFQFVRDRWQDIQNFISGVYNFLVNNIFNPLGNFFTQTIPSWAQSLANFIRDRWNDIQNTINTVYNWVVNNVFNPIGNFFTQTIPNWAQTLANFIRDRWNDIQNVISTPYNWIVNNVFNPLNTFFTQTIPGWANTLRDRVKQAFQEMKDGIGTIWAGVQDLVKKPVNFIIGTVYMNGIRKLWNATAAKIPGIPDLPEIQQLAEGGGISGGTPGKDSVPAMLMPGEHVLTTKDVQAIGGQESVYRFRSALHKGGVKGYAEGGTVVPTGADVQPDQPFGPSSVNPGPPKKKGGGGILGTGIGPDVGPDLVPDGIISDIGGAIGAGWEKLKDIAATVMYDIAAPIGNSVVNSIPDPVFGWKQDIGHLPRYAGKEIMHHLLDFFKQKQEEAKAAQMGGANVQAALAWARTQNGKPYQWGGNGDPSWDCSGFMAAIQEVILGNSPHRVWTTFDFQGANAPQGWKRDLKAPFMIGVTNDGVGHTAGTLAGVNVESAGGGKGVVVGGNARGYDDPMFNEGHYGFEPSIGGAGSAPSGDIAAWIAAAMAAAGVSGAAWTNGINTIIQRESGGNPKAINLSDTNAQHGTPSKGLMQVIDPTFDTYHVPGTSTDIYDPVANIAAAIRYIIAFYGDISNVQQANPNLPPQGYAAGGEVHAFANGGWIEEPVWGVGKSGRRYTFAENEAEYVVSGRDMRRGGPQRGGGSGGSCTVRVEMPDKITVRIGEDEFDAVVTEKSYKVVESVLGTAQNSR